MTLQRDCSATRNNGGGKLAAVALMLAAAFKVSAAVTIVASAVTPVTLDAFEGFNVFSESEEDEAVEVVSVKNDKAAITWTLPAHIEKRVVKQRLMISLLPGETSTSASTYSVSVRPTLRTYTFENLAGNTSYRASVEAFGTGERSLWYASNTLHTSLAALDWLPAPKDVTLLARSNATIELSWAIPLIVQGTSSALISQHFLNVYEFVHAAKSFVKRTSYSVPIPKHDFVIPKLSAGIVYNITLQAGTSFGYGQLAWSVFSTLPDGDETQLTLRDVTPNSMTLAWPVAWMSSPSAKCTIRARSIRTSDNDAPETELVNTATPDLNGKAAEFTIRNLRPSTAYNITVTTSEHEIQSLSGRYVAPLKKKSIWSAYSTLVQGEYTVSEARLVVETDHAASFVWQPLQNLGEITYQVRYMSHDDLNEQNVTYTEEMSEEQLRCPKYGCTWHCALLFNLPRRPRDFAFFVRARVDGLWNKWTPVQRKPWNILERVCSINPPPYVVLDAGDDDFQREIEVSSAIMPPSTSSRDVWRYLVVVDSRETGRYSAIDITKLSDKVTADFDHLPYYIAGALTPAEVRAGIPFSIGDGRVHGGYLNYPLADRSSEPKWSLVPLTQSENEIMEPRLRTCGFNEDGYFECELSWSELAARLPLWAKAGAFLCLLLFIAPILLAIYCILFKCRKVKTIHKESNLMYYSSESADACEVTREFRRVQQRAFEPSQTEERIEFMNSDD